MFPPIRLIEFWWRSVAHRLARYNRNLVNFPRQGLGYRRWTSDREQLWGANTPHRTRLKGRFFDAPRVERLTVYR